MAITLRPRQEKAIADLRIGSDINGNTVTAYDGRKVHFLCRHGVEFSRWYASDRIDATRCPCDHKVTSNNRKHGAKGTPEYSAWSNMKTRCYNPKFVDWELYGGRGVTVCDRWSKPVTSAHSVSYRRGWTVERALTKIPTRSRK